MLNNKPAVLRAFTAGQIDIECKKKFVREGAKASRLIT